MDSHSWMLYISIVVLLLLSAFFSASETALSSLNKIRLKKRAQDGDPRAATALALTEQYHKTLNTILVANNLVNIATSTIMALIFTSLFHTYGPLISTIVTTILVLIAGEILPKSYANAHSDELALRIARPLRAVSAVLTPVTFLFGKLQHVFHEHTSPEEKAPSITEEELLYFIESIEEEGVLEEEESNLVQSALEFDETSLGEIITPRVNLVALDVDSSQEEIREVLIDARHSRLPVYEGSMDNIIGVIFVRGAIGRMLQGEELSLREIADKPYFVPKGMKLSALMAVFRSKQARIAIVLDEYGGTLGIVTLRDLVEELVGDIQDEEEEKSLLSWEEDRVVVDGSYDLEDLWEELALPEQEDQDDYSTVSGWAISLFGRIPEDGEELRGEDFLLTVLEMDGNRIKRLALRLLPQEASLEEESGRKQGKE